MSLNPYTGEWNSKLAAHLLRRTSFSATKAQVDLATQDGMDQTVDQILTLKPNDDLPLNYGFPDDPDVPIGETWINAGISDIMGLARYRGVSLYGWITKKMLEPSISIQEKMALFWHNHFVIADNDDARFVWRYFSLLRENCLGDFRQMVKDIAIDPSMLRYLNGNENTKQAPNENFARELLELFTVGKGAIVGDGDYSTFTEQDVSAVAKIMTGWRDTGYFNPNGIPVDSIFIQNRHDTSAKTLSHRFDNAVIENANETEYADLVDVILGKDYTSKHIVRKIYRWFLYYEITEEVETTIIEPLAQIFVDNDYDINSVMDVLLRSEHFFTDCHVGAMIKNPMDFALGTMGFFELPTNIPDLNEQYNLWASIAYAVGLLQMTMFGHPSVAGWKAYYQEPVFYRIWLNSVTLPIRKTLIDVFWIAGIELESGEKLRIDAFKILEWVSEPTDINKLIEETSDLIFPRALNDTQKVYLKEIVLQGLPDFEWTVEYAEYLGDPDNEAIKNSIEVKLVLLFVAMCQLPEYQLS